jgi:hypothetical protein
MNSAPDDPLTLTGPHDSLDTALEACHAALEDLAPPILDACAEHTDAILADVLDDGDVAPGVELADDRDVTVFRQFVTNRLTEYWFADLNGRGSDLDLGWNEFQTAVRLYTECVYLRAFDAYGTATDSFSAVEHARTKAKRLHGDIETRLQREDRAAMTENEDSLESLLADAGDRVSEAAQRLEDAETALVRAHAYYAIAECYREEYDFDDDAFDYVSLRDDPEWFLEDLRHRRDRLSTRVDWLRRDRSKLTDRA